MSTLTSLISAGGGGGGTPVNTIAQLYVGGETLYEDPTGGEWLKTGNLIGSGLENYPDAYLTGGYIPTTSYANISKSVAAQISTSSGVTWGDSGTKIYVAGYNSTVVYQYNLSTAYDVSTATYSTSRNFSDYLTTHVFSINFNNTGTRCYVPGDTDQYTVYQYDLSTAWNISTATVNNSFTTFNDSMPSPRFIKFNSDGTKFYKKDIGIIGQFNASTPFSIASATYVGLKNIANLYSNTFYISQDGSYIIIGVSNALQKWNLSTPFAISTATYSGEQSPALTQESSTSQGGDFTPDLTKFIKVGATNNTVYQYNLGEVIGLSVDTGDYDYLKIK